MALKSLQQYSYTEYDILKMLLNSIKVRKYSFTKVSLPIYLNFAITYKCNSRCMTCGIWQKYNDDFKTSDKILSLDDIETFFSNKAFLKNIMEVNLTGGEPFLRNDLVEIIQIIVNNLPEARIAIANNGIIPSIVEEKLKKMLEITNKFHISVSIDGIEKTHDEIRGIAGAYEKTIKTLNIITKLKIKYPKLGLTIGMTLTSLNYDQILHVHTLAKKFRANFTCRSMHHSDFYFSNTQQMKNLKMTEDQIDRIEKQIRKLPYDINLFFLEGVPEYLRNPKKQSFSCYSGLTSCFIDPYGDVYPCQFMNITYGNIKDDNLFEMWNSKAVKEIRTNISKGNCPNCWNECETLKTVRLRIYPLLKWQALRYFSK